MLQVVLRTPVTSPVQGFAGGQAGQVTQLIDNGGGGGGAGSSRRKQPD